MALVLVVDDDADIRELTKFYLEKLGHEVLEAKNGILAEGICDELANLHNKTPDLVITDIIMPKQGGLKTIEDLDAHYPNMPIIAMSAGGRYRIKDYAKEVREMGIKMLIKPFSENDFVNAVKEYI